MEFDAISKHEVVHAAVQRHDPAVQQIARRHELPSEVVDDEYPVVGLHLHRRGIDAGGFVEAQFQHAGDELAADHNARTFAQDPALIDVGIVHDVELLMDHGIVQADDLPVDFYGVRHQDRVRIDAQHALGETGFAVSGRTVDKDGVLRNQRRSELVQQPVRDDEIREGSFQGLAVDVHLRRLGFRGVVVVAQGHRRGAGVLRDLETLRGQKLAGPGQGEVIVVPHHAFDLQELLLPHLLKNRVQDWEGEAQLFSKALQVAESFEQQPPEHQIHDQGFGNPKFFKGLWHPGGKSPEIADRRNGQS